MHPTFRPPSPVPPGYIDVPYSYVYDPTAAGLVNGSSYRHLAVQVNDKADFVLRRIAGLPGVANTFSLRNACGQLTNGSRTTGLTCTGLHDLAIVPELSFPLGSKIDFDLGTVAVAVNAGPTAYGQIVFQGVWRTNHPIYLRRFDSAYEYKLKPWAYLQQLTINWVPGAAADPQRYSLLVQDWDFELHAVHAVHQTSNLAPFAQFRMQLWDPFPQRWASAPVNDFVFMGNAYPGLGPPPPAAYMGVMPVPPILYPVGSEIQFEIWSLLGGGYPLELVFSGVRRVRT